MHDLMYLGVFLLLISSQITLLFLCVKDKHKYHKLICNSAVILLSIINITVQTKYYILSVVVSFWIEWIINYKHDNTKKGFMFHHSICTMLATYPSLYYIKHPEIQIPLCGIHLVIISEIGSLLLGLGSIFTKYRNFCKIMWILFRVFIYGLKYTQFYNEFIRLEKKTLVQSCIFSLFSIIYILNIYWTTEIVRKVVTRKSDSKDIRNSKLDDRQNTRTMASCDGVDKTHER